MLCGHVCISAMQNQMGLFVGFFLFGVGFFFPKILSFMGLIT